tara:strand:- start:2405 stop:2884 length:480 start_codon:yes stop_codon:yes gene_type:complete
MKYTYGIGAAIVIMGALFKIMHWPFASEMLIVGLSVEAMIFLMSVAEPVHMEKDWTRVFPELDDGSDGEVALYDLLDGGSKEDTSLKPIEIDEMDKIRDSISILSSNLDTLNEVIKDMSDDLKESSKDSVQYKDSMKSLSKNISNLNSKYESVVNALKS